MATVDGVDWPLNSALGCGGPCGGPLQDIAGAVTSPAGVQPKPPATSPTSPQVAAATGRLSCYTPTTVLAENLEPASAAAGLHPEAVDPCVYRGQLAPGAGGIPTGLAPVLSVRWDTTWLALLVGSVEDFSWLSPACTAVIARATDRSLVRARRVSGPDFRSSFACPP